MVSEPNSGCSDRFMANTGTESGGDATGEGRSILAEEWRSAPVTPIKECWFPAKEERSKAVECEDDDYTSLKLGLGQKSTSTKVAHYWSKVAQRCWLKVHWHAKKVEVTGSLWKACWRATVDWKAARLGDRQCSVTSLNYCLDHSCGLSTLFAKSAFQRSQPRLLEQLKESKFWRKEACIDEVFESFTT